MKDHKYGFIDTTGKLLNGLQWDWARSFSEGFAVVGEGEAGFVFDGKHGFIDQSGKLISVIQWDFASDYEDGFAFVKEDGKTGYRSSGRAGHSEINSFGLFRISIARFYSLVLEWKRWQQIISDVAAVVNRFNAQRLVQNLNKKKLSQCLKIS